MRMRPRKDLRHLIIRIPLMRDAHLMITRDFIIAGFAPSGGADEMLGFEVGVADDVRVQGHFYELVGGHCFPHFVEEGAVVHL